MSELSPFLHREVEQVREGQRVRHLVRLGRRAQTYAEACVPTPEEQRARIETFRYRWYERNGTLGRFMQRLGDWGRKHFPFVGYGWNGLGPRA